MNRFLLIAATLALATPAFASKARIAALGNDGVTNMAPGYKDAQTAFDNPSDLLLVADYATFEMGPTTALTTGTDAEGGFSMTKGDGKLGFYVGRKSKFTTDYRAALGVTGQENPIELQYAQNGPLKWGAALNYSASDKKSAGSKQTAIGARFGVNADNWDAYAVIGLGSTATGNGASLAATAPLNTITADPNSDFKGTIGFKLGGSYKMNTLQYYAQYYTDGAEYTSTVNTNANNLKTVIAQLDLGVVENNKVEGGTWFYGVSIRDNSLKRDGAATAFNAEVKTTQLPFILGVEMDANSWMVLRGSVTQNVLLGTTQTDAAGATGDKDTISNNTAVAAGLGLKLNKWMLDSTLTAATTGNVNMTTFMARSGLTYNF